MTSRGVDTAAPASLGAGDRAPGAGPGGADLRLAVPVLACWCALRWALGHSALAVVGGSVASMAIAGLGLWLGPRLRDRARLAAAVRTAALSAAVCALVLGPAAARIHLARDPALFELAARHTTVTVEVTVESDPRVLQARSPTGSERSAVSARLTGLVLDRGRVSMRDDVLLLVPSRSWQSVGPGQRVRCDARLLLPPPTTGLLSAVLGVQGPPQQIGRAPFWQRGATAVRQGLQRATRGLPPLPGGLLPGIVDGDTTRLDPVLAQRFRVAGLTHLVAVSGTNVSIVIGAVALTLRRLRASPRLTMALGLVTLVGFVVLARPSPSVLRAAMMAAIGLGALAAGRPRTTVPILSASVLLLLLWHPSLAADLGFLLSVSATAALLLIAPSWAEALRRRKVPPLLAEGLAVAAAAHVVTAPLIAAVSGQVSLVAIPANLLAEPVVAVATVLGLLCALTSVIWIPAAGVLAQLACWPCRWLVWVAETFGAMPGASLPWPSGGVGALLLVTASLLLARAALSAKGRPVLAVAMVIALVVQVPVRMLVDGWPARGWIMVACDVGQGDALVLPAGAGAAVVVDAGPDPLPVDRCLRGLGVRRVALLVLTHPHLDHVGGIAGVWHQRTVTGVVVSAGHEPVAGVRLVAEQARAHGVPVATARPGDTWVVGAGGDAVSLTVLGPVRVLRGTRSDPNNNSLVMLAVSHGVRIMLAADAEIEEQDELLGLGDDLRADVLKVPHHGSAYSDRAFLAAVGARIGVISVGRGNDYGHPAPSLLRMAADLGVAVARTDLSGDVAVVRRGGTLSLVARAPQAGDG